MGKALYRKYRPLALKDVVGQDSVTKALESSLKKGKISHAYLFTGPRGCGKTSVARIFAHEINKFKYELEDSYVDIIEIDAASNTGVDNIRELREKAIIAPTTGKYKVYIIDEVHMLSKSAFNALLKIMEEPPAHVVFIMATTNPEKVPITITSRATTYNFSLAPLEIIEKHLKTIAKQEKINITDDALAIIAKRGGGSFRDSISLLDQISTLSTNQITAESITKALGLPQDKFIKDLLEAFAVGNGDTITDCLHQALDAGVREEALVSELIQQIVAEPKSEYLPLLAKLPQVTAPFITAKLLTAFLGEGQAKVPIIVAATASSPAPITTATSSTISPTPPTEFSWPSFLREIEQSSASSLYSVLSSCRHAIINNELHLYSNKFGQRILDSPANRNLILEHLGGLNFVTHDSSDTPPDSVLSKNAQPSNNDNQTTGTINQIFDIIDETKEDSYAGEIPF